jgi:hypothetical protein
MKSLKWMILAVAVIAAAGAAFAEDRIVSASEPDARTRLELTVYNSDLALVRETRTVALPRGESWLEFRGVPARINPRTLIIDRSGGSAFHLIEQSYEFDLMSKSKILEKYVGRDLTWIQEDGRRINGTLLGTAEGPVYKVDGEIVFEVPGRLALPSLPQNLRARPTMVWRLNADRAGDRDLDVSYLTGGLTWSADYVLQLDDAGEEADIQAWVTVENRSGTSFEDAGLMLLAGDVNRVTRAVQRNQFKGQRVEMAAMADGMAEESVGDYHLYTAPGRTTLRNQEIKQVSMFTSSDVPVSKHYRLESGYSGRYFGGGAPGGNEKISVIHEIKNTEAANLGVPMPAGVVRVYGKSSSGARQLLGEARIDHTPKDETLRLRTGYAFDLVAERRRTAYRSLGERTHESEWEIELRNRSDNDVVIEVLESMPGEWTVLETSHEFKKLSAFQVRFDVPVTAGKTTVLRYRVRTSN